MKRWAARHRLGPHFTLQEFSDWHVHRLPPIAAQKGLEHLVRVFLEPLRSRFGPVHVASGYRTAQTNREVGGAPASRHLYDRFGATPAADITVEHATPEQVFDFLDARGAGGLGLYRGHVHVDARPGRARWSDLAAE